MCQFVGRIGCVCRGRYAIESMDSPIEGHDVNLDVVRTIRQPWPCFDRRVRTVFKENIPATLSYSVPTLTCQLSSRARARARLSVLCFVSLAVYDWPDTPHVYGSRDLSSATLPCFSSSRKSQMGTVSGIGNSKSGTHFGGRKTMATPFEGEKSRSVWTRRISKRPSFLVAN